MLTKRQEAILVSLLEAVDGISSRKLAENLGVSARTVRNDMSELDALLSRYGITLLHSAAEGYRIRKSELPAAQEVLVSSRQKNAGRILPQTPSERQIYLLFLLLDVEGPQELDSLAEELYISKSTLQNDLKQLQQIVGRSGKVTLDLRGGQVSLEGEEQELRDIIYRQIIEHYEDSVHDYIRSLFVEYGILEENLYLKLFDYLVERLDEKKIILSDESIYVLSRMILVSVHRLRQGHCLESWEKEEENRLAIDFPMLEVLFGLEIPPRERGYILYLCNHNRIIDYADEPYRNQRLTTTITGEFIERICEEYHFDPRTIRQYSKNLQAHINMLLHRLKLKVHTDEDAMPLYIKNTYPFAFEVALWIIPIIRAHIGEEIPDPEIYYIAIHIAVILEDIRERPNVVIVCGKEPTMVALLERRLKNQFGSRLNLVEICPRYRLSQMLKERDDIDLLLSLGGGCDSDGIPVIQIDEQLSQASIRRINQFLGQSFLWRDPGRTSLRDLFRKELFWLSEEHREEKELLAGMIAEMERLGFLSSGQEFYRSVMEREAIQSTWYGDIWIPHAMQSMGLKNVVAAAILSQEKKLVFLVSCKKGEAYTMGELFERISEFLNDEAMLESLRGAADFQSFTEIFCNPD